MLKIVWFLQESLKFCLKYSSLPFESIDKAIFPSVFEKIKCGNQILFFKFVSKKFSFSARFLQVCLESLHVSSVTTSALNCIAISSMEIICMTSILTDISVLLPLEEGGNIFLCGRHFQRKAQKSFLKLTSINFKICHKYLRKYQKNKYDSGFFCSERHRILIKKGNYTYYTYLSSNQSPVVCQFKDD